MTDWKQLWLGQGIFPYGPLISNMYALEAALKAVLDEGLDVVLARHARVAQAIRAGVTGMGLQLYPVSDQIASDVNTTIIVPANLKPKQVITHVAQKYGADISASTLSGTGTVRIGHMGMQTRGLYSIQTLAAVGQGMWDLGVKVNV